MMRNWPALPHAATDVWVAALLIAGGGLVFGVENLVLAVSAGGVGVLPILVFVLEVGAAVVVLAGFRPGRPVVLVVVVLVALLHMLIALSGGPGWIRVLAAVLAVAHMYALVVLNTKPVREHFGLAR